MSILRNRALLLASSVLGMALLSSPATAQQAAEGASDNAGIQEIVVTAQRRSESLLAVPLAISASTGDQLVSQGIKQITDLQFTTPGYNVSDSNGYTQIFIRGVGNGIFVGADPSVATFIDDVPRIFGSMVNNFVDVERVEVLKGAQGGLYGRNATGGVVNIITRQPSTDAVKGDLRVTYAEHNTFQASAYINVPISEQVAFSVAGERRSRDGYIKNSPSTYTAAMFPTNTVIGTPAATAAFLNSGIDRRDTANEDFWAGNAKLLLKPSEDIKITLVADWSKKDDRNGNSQFNVTPAYTQLLVSGTLAAFGIPNNLPAGFIKGAPGKFEIANGNPGFVYLKDYGFSGTVTWALPGVDLTSITAYRKQETDFLDDLGGSSVPFQAAHVNNRKNYTYQEFRALSTFEGPLSLIGGATYLKSNFHGLTDVDLLTPVLVGLPVARADVVVKNWSIYGQATYDVTDNVSVIASGRYIHEKNNAFFPLSGTPFGAVEKKFLPSATISYKLEGRGNVYLRWARGFKSGGINPVADVAGFPNPRTDGSVFSGETVDTYEAGYRAPLFDRRVQLTAAVFYNDYKNLQTAAHANAANQARIILAIINAGTARTYGAEASIQWRVNDPITLGFNAGYLNAKYKKFALLASNVLDPFDLSGTQMTNAPEFQGSFTANLDQPITDDFRLVANAMISRTSKVLWQVSGLPGVMPAATDNGYWLTNARIGIRTTDDKFGFALFANNLFNNAYTTFGNSAAGTSTQLTWGSPRIFGAEASMKF